MEKHNQWTSKDNFGPGKIRHSMYWLWTSVLEHTNICASSIEV